jgi:hypothetical protein
VRGLAPQRDSAESPAQRATGVFLSANTGRVIQLGTAPADTPWLKKGAQIASIDGYDLPVDAVARNVLRPAGAEGSMKLELALGGDPANPSSIRLSDFGNVDHLERAQPADGLSAKAIEGHYVSRAAGAEIRIVETSAGSRMHTLGRFGSEVYSLTPLAPGIWRAKIRRPLSARGGTLVFDADGGRFRYSSVLRTRSLPFVRS